MSTEATKPGRLTELDALRGIAALGVLLFHYSDQFDQMYDHVGRLSYGFDVGRYGVLLFFVISGFVIFWSLERTRHAWDFVVHRFARLFPAYWAALALTYVLVHTVGLPGQEVTATDAVLNLTMVPDFLGAHEVDGSYWTLQVELFFYMQMLGWFMLGQLKRIRWVVISWLVLASAYAISARMDFSLSYTLRELLIVRYICYFAAGILLYRMRSSGDEVGNWILLAACVVVSWLTWSWREALVLSVCIVIFRFLIAGSLAFLSWRPLVFLGSISYTLYLLHQEIGYILIDALEREGVYALVSIAAVTATMILFAWLMSRFVERPAMRMLRAAYARMQPGRSQHAGGGVA